MNKKTMLIYSTVVLLIISYLMIKSALSEDKTTLQEDPFQESKIYYVDSIDGLDDNDGSINAPISSLDTVNKLILQPGDQVLFKRGRVYRGQLYPQSGLKDDPVYYGSYGEGDLPILMGSINADLDSDWLIHTSTIYVLNKKLPYDIGNIIFDQGNHFGVKKWSDKALSNNGDYYYDADEERLYLYDDTEPWLKYTSIECAVTVDIIDQSNCSYVTYENLALRYGGGHGIGGGNTQGMIIRGLDISYIGGGLLRQDGNRYIQYGNGIEFWANALDHIVEDCNIYEIFDTGVSNQNNGKKARQENIVYKNNIISKCAMASFELDNEPEKGTMYHIYFENNVCSDVGLGWGATQDRHFDPSMNVGLGHHVTIFYMATPTDNIVIRNNDFNNAFHPDDLSSMYLFANLEEQSRQGYTFENNSYLGQFDTFGYWVEGNNIKQVDDEFIEQLN